MPTKGNAAVKSLFHLILTAATFVLAAVTVLASRSGHYHPESSTVMPLLGLAVPVLLVSCLIVSLCWAVARKKWAFVTLIAFFVNWEYLTAVIRFGYGYVQGINAAAEEDGVDVNVKYY